MEPDGTAADGVVVTIGRRITAADTSAATTRDTLVATIPHIMAVIIAPDTTRDLMAVTALTMGAMAATTAPDTTVGGDPPRRKEAIRRPCQLKV